MALSEKRFEDAAGYVNSFLKTKKDIIDLAEKITSGKTQTSSFHICQQNGCHGMLCFCYRSIYL